MQLIKALYDWGFLNNDVIFINGEEVGIVECISRYLMTSQARRTTDLYGYALHVEVEGIRDGAVVTSTLTHTHPPSDGSVPDWQGFGAMQKMWPFLLR